MIGVQRIADETASYRRNIGEVLRLERQRAEAVEHALLIERHVFWIGEGVGHAKAIAAPMHGRWIDETHQ